MLLEGSTAQRCGWDGQYNTFPDADLVQEVAPDGYKIRGGLNQPDNPCEGCPNNPKYLKTQYIGVPCQWCQKNLYKVTYTSNVKQGE